MRPYRTATLLQLELPRAHLLLDGLVQPVGDSLQPLPALLLRQGQLAALHPVLGLALSPVSIGAGAGDGLEAVPDALADAVADTLLDVLAEEILGYLVHQVKVPDPPEAHHRQDVVVVELGADPLQECLVLLRLQDEVLRAQNNKQSSATRDFCCVVLVPSDLINRGTE